ncbi:type II toxin-antitoxin system VapC family toxin [Terriglobus saanensis]|uniref:Ribonuclease VapC n=1 Tax=Terriglobus saanensis (strain ATCC BAA-1853 / DSM 23119 / SP1PR4) TaxID=401053 RepID=E8V0M3_TERSS|nr:PIN domain nuclease [Terriglobus saanensis]ADV81086.1 PilT protein domain protein [Terriglobus saanensis SP1PR4]
MIVVDTSVWIDLLRGTENSESLWLREALGHRPIALTDLTLCEVLQGISQKRSFDNALKRLSTLKVYECCGPRMAIAAAANFQTLRRRGLTVRKTIDCLIATFCIEQKHTLLHRDRDFDAFEQHLDLKVLHP